MKIEKATILDIEAVSALLTAQLTDHDIALDAERVRRGVVGILEVPSRGAILVARDGGGVIGIALLATTWTVEHGGLVAWLDELFVVPERRGGGVGQALLAGALSEARSVGCVAVELEVDVGHARAEHLYARNGFVRLPRARWVCSLATPAAPAQIGVVFAPRASVLEKLDHVSLGVNDLTRSRAFYDAALAPLGWVAHPQTEGEVGYGPPLYEEAGALPLYIGFEDCSERRHVEPSHGFHIAIRASSRLAVQAFHRAALASGGKDRGEPGLRPHYHSAYYGAFVVDPDGHHVEAVFHG